MTALWLMIAGLILLAIGFICFPLLPFNRRKEYCVAQQQQNIDIFRDRLQELEQEKLQGNMTEAVFLKLKIELEKNLLKDTQGATVPQYADEDVTNKQWMLSVFMCVAVTVVSLAMYGVLGRSDDLFISQVMANEKPAEQNNTNPEAMSMEKAIAVLESKVAETPEDKEKLLLLANSYAAIGQFAKAANVYEKLSRKAEKGSEEYAGLKGAQAQSLFQLSNERMTKSVKVIIQQALKADPQEPASLMLLGIEAFTSENYQQAIDHWKKAKIKAEKPQIERFINPAIKAAQQKLGIAESQFSVEKTTAQATTTNAARVTIDLTLNPSLRDRVTDDQYIFVFARPNGGRMPLAAERIQVKDLPAHIVLDDTKAAMPTAKLSSAEQVEITARISKSGQPMPQPGDLYVTINGVEVKKQPVLALEINQVVE